MAVELPEDILHLICDELRVRQDLSTLFNCAVTSKRLAPLALASLYRAGGGSPAEDDELQARFGNAELLRQKWSIYWRSVTLASLGKTMYPYHAYLKSLDFRDLGHLLDDLRTYRNIEKVFFKGDLARFRHVGPPDKWAPKGRLDTAKIVNDLGATIASNASMIEVISGKISPTALKDWIPRLSHLKSLELEDGAEHPAMVRLIQVSMYLSKPLSYQFGVLCLQLPNLSMTSCANYVRNAVNADEQLGKFITGLPEESLRVFTTISNCGVSTETCLALNRHGDSLRSLEFVLEQDSIPALALLGRCTGLEIFKLEASPRINILETHKEVFDEFSIWLSGCERLREIQLVSFNHGPAALTPLLLNDNVRLEKLCTRATSQTSQFKTYHGESARTFHQALVNQSATLQTLEIRGQINEAEDLPTVQDAEILVETIRQLKMLTTLKIFGIMDENFNDDSISRLLSPLKQLEEVAFAGYGVTDRILETLSSLRHLKQATVMACSRFSVSGLLDFINKLGPGNQGMALALDWPDHDFSLNPEEVAIVSSSIEAAVNGTFDYTAPRDPNADYGDDSDAEYDGSD